MSRSCVHRHLALVGLLLLLLTAACAHAPTKNAQAPETVAQGPAPQAVEAAPVTAAAPAEPQAKAEDPAVTASHTQVEQGLAKNAAFFEGSFTDDYGDEDARLVADPIRPWNVVWYHFNDVLYEGVFRPLGKGYTYVTPEPVRQGVLNFFYNLKFPIRFVNNLLQGKVTAAGVEMSRFLGNTLFGGLGLMDITKHKQAAAPTPPEDFGQTLAAWGVGDGFYIVWPLLGPSTARDSVGTVGDWFLDPISFIDPWFLPYSSPWWQAFVPSAARTFVTTADRIDAVDALKASAVDPYTAFRNAYIQNRQRQIAQ